MRDNLIFNKHLIRHFLRKCHLLLKEKAEQKAPLRVLRKEVLSKVLFVQVAQL